MPSNSKAYIISGYFPKCNARYIQHAHKYNDEIYFYSTQNTETASNVYPYKFNTKTGLLTNFNSAIASGDVRYPHKPIRGFKSNTSSPYCYRKIINQSRFLRQINLNTHTMTNVSGDLGVQYAFEYGAFAENGDLYTFAPNGTAYTVGKYNFSTNTMTSMASTSTLPSEDSISGGKCIIVGDEMYHIGYRFQNADNQYVQYMVYNIKTNTISDVKKMLIPITDNARSPFVLIYKDGFIYLIPSKSIAINLGKVFKSYKINVNTKEISESSNMSTDLDVDAIIDVKEGEVIAFTNELTHKIIVK